MYCCYSSKASKTKEPIKVKTANDHELEGNKFYAEGDYKKAVESYNQSLAIESKNAVIHTNKGLALQKLGQLEDALKSFDEALEKDPEGAKSIAANTATYRDSLLEEIEKANNAKERP